MNSELRSFVNEKYQEYLDLEKELDEYKSKCSDLEYKNERLELEVMQLEAEVRQLETKL